MAQEYPQTAVNKLGRKPNQGRYDFPTIHGLINTCPVLHVSFVDPEHAFPVVLPMLGCTGNFADQAADPNTSVQDIYLHGYISGRLFKPRNDNKDSDKDNVDGTHPALPITLSATFLDGLVLALTPFHNSCNYRSATVFGHAHIVTDPDEATYALRAITENMLPGRWAASRVPPSRAEMSSTGILRVSVHSASAKMRVGGPSEDRVDLRDGDLVGRVWTGVVPYWGAWGEPVPGRENGRAEVEGYVERWRVGETARARGYAFEAVGMEGGKK